MRRLPEHEERIVSEVTRRIGSLLFFFERRILMAVGAAQASVDRLVAVAEQAGEELLELKEEVDKLQAAGVDVTAAKAAADRLEATIATVKSEAAEIPLSGDQESRADAAALAAVPEGSTILRSETDAQGSAMEVHVAYPDGTQVTVKLDADFNVTEIVPGDDDTTANPNTGGGGNTVDPGTGAVVGPDGSPVDPDPAAPVVGGADGPQNPNANPGTPDVGNTDASGTTENTGNAGETATQ